VGALARGFALLLVLAAAACGESEDAGAPAGAETSVEVTVWPGGQDSGEPTTAVLECEPAGGDHPNPEEACAALVAEEDALQPVPGDVACTQIYGGDEEARIAGTVRGNAVDSMFSRSNGCEIDRWDRLAPVFEIG
jgi:Subtilisin inhibitor-like